MELIRGDVSSTLGACLANAFLLDLKAMDLLKPDLDVKQIIVDKSKMDREKARIIVKVMKSTMRIWKILSVLGKIEKVTMALC